MCGKLFVTAVALVVHASASDWPQFLGPARDGVYAEADLADSWPKEGPPVTWQKKIGQGFSSPAVSSGKLILFHRLADKEILKVTPIAGQRAYVYTSPMDAEGFVTFVDRKKDALRRRGENVSSMELEAAIRRYPAIAEVAVHAVESAATEDDIKACVVPQAGAPELTPDELFGFFAEALPYFAVPRYVEVVPELPKNALGRVLKHELRARGVTPATWDFDKLGLAVEHDRRRGGGRG